MFDGKYDELLGKNFKYAEQDCLTSLTSYFSKFENIEIDNTYSRWEGWDREGHNLFVENFKKEGFEILDFPRGDNWGEHLQTSDVLLMSIHGLSDRRASGVANHCAVWLEPRMILHHLYGRRSQIIPFKYKNATTHVLRHKDIPLREKEVEKVSFLDILPVRKREQFENVRASTT